MMGGPESPRFVSPPRRVPPPAPWQQRLVRDEPKTGTFKTCHPLKDQYQSRVQYLLNGSAAVQPPAHVTASKHINLKELKSVATTHSYSTVTPQHY